MIYIRFNERLPGCWPYSEERSHASLAFAPGFAISVRRKMSFKPLTWLKTHGDLQREEQHSRIPVSSVVSAHGDDVTVSDVYIECKQKTSPHRPQAADSLLVLGCYC